jgi:hypothetical protein
LIARRVQLRTLHSERFLREIHHLLWSATTLSGNVVDAGWNCRDHAWVMALLIRALGYKTVLIHGEAHFIKGPNGNSGSVSYFQRPHTWLAVENVGAIDVSARAKFRVGGDRFQTSITCIFADEWLPHGRGKSYFFTDANAYARAVDELSARRNQLSAVYLNQEAEQLHEGLLSRAAGWIGSPLTKQLDSSYGNPSDLYAALLLHLYSYLAGDAPSLTRLPAEQSWAQLAHARVGAIDRARQMTGLSEPSVVRAPAKMAEGVRL